MRFSSSPHDLDPPQAATVLFEALNMGTYQKKGADGGRMWTGTVGASGHSGADRADGEFESRFATVATKSTKICGHVVGTTLRPRSACPREIASELLFSGGRDRRRSGDLTLFRRALYLLSYPTG